MTSIPKRPLLAGAALAAMAALAAPLRAQLAWTPDSTASRPAAMQGHAIAATDTGLMLFGGFPAAETWEYRNGAWTRVQTNHAPPPRVGHAMAFHPPSGRTVLFGGWIPGGATLGDTWVFDGSDWSEQTSTPAPPPLRDTALAYHDRSVGLVLFGGTDAQRALSGETWVWSGFRWQQLAPQFAPPARSGHAMTSTPDGILLFGGNDPFGSLADTWRYDGRTWIRHPHRLAPPARADHSLSWDSDRQRAVLHGGMSQNFGQAVLDDTWEYGELGWRETSPAVRGPAILDHATAYDPGSLQVVLFGGQAWRPGPGGNVVPQPVDDLVRYAPGTRATWSQVTTSFCGGYQALRFHNMPLLGSPEFRFDAPVSPAFFGLPFVAFLATGFQPTPLNLGPCALHVAGTIEPLLSLSPVSAGFVVPIPADPALRGAQLHVQVAGPESSPLSGFQRFGLSPTYRFTIGD